MNKLFCKGKDINYYNSLITYFSGKELNETRRKCIIFL